MMIGILLIIYQSFMARAAGGGLFSNRVWPMLPEIFFAVPFGIYGWHATGLPWVGILAYLIAWAGIELAHGTFFKMAGRVHDDEDRTSPVEWIVQPIFDWRGWNIYSPGYSWACMALKGAVIGAAAFPYGLALIPLWPFAYWIGWRVENTPNTSEWLSGMFAGAVLAAAISA